MGFGEREMTTRCGVRPWGKAAKKRRAREAAADMGGASNGAVEGWRGRRGGGGESSDEAGPGHSCQFQLDMTVCSLCTSVRLLTHAHPSHPPWPYSCPLGGLALRFSWNGDTA